MLGEDRGSLAVPWKSFEGGEYWQETGTGEDKREKRTRGSSKVGEGCMEVSASWLLLGKSLGTAVPLESGTY